MMSPAIALRDFALITYVAAVTVLIGAAGVLLLSLTYGWGYRLGSVWRTYTSWLVMVPIVLVVLVAGRVATILSVAVAASFAFREYARATGLSQDRWITGA